MLIEKERRKKEKQDKIHQNYLKLKRQEKQVKDQNIWDNWVSLSKTFRSGIDLNE